MQITGYKLKEAIQTWEMRRQSLNDEWNLSLAKFEKEEKRTPTEIYKDIRTAELAIAHLQATQAKYNIDIKVDIIGEAVTLCEAVKRVGGANRLRSMWDAALEKRRHHSYHHQDDPNVRDPTKEYSEGTVTPQEVAKHKEAAQKYVNALRAGINMANAVSTNLDIDPKLFE